jgi:hypothetical protein
MAVCAYVQRAPSLRRTPSLRTRLPTCRTASCLMSGGTSSPGVAYSDRFAAGLGSRPADEPVVGFQHPPDRRGGPFGAEVSERLGRTASRYRPMMATSIVSAATTPNSLGSAMGASAWRLPIFSLTWCSKGREDELRGGVSRHQEGAYASGQKPWMFRFSGPLNLASLFQSDQPSTCLSSLRSSPEVR